MDDDSSDRIVTALQSWLPTARPGQRLPSTRALTAAHGASPLTVQKAIRRLTGLGLIEPRPGVGTFVRGAHPVRPADHGWQTAALGAPQSRVATLSSTQRPAAPDAMALHSGYPAPGLLPERLVRQALARAARGESAMTRSPAAGLPALQALFAAELASAVPAGVTPPGARDVTVLSGSQSALSSVFRTMVGPGRPLLIESPTYWGAILAADQAGVVLVPVPTGVDGPDPDEVDRAFARTGARAFYAQPTFANPTGGQWPDATGRAVLDAVRRHGAFLVEDDWAHDFGIDAEPRSVMALDDDGHVVYLRSLTKSVSPALRVAAVVARGPARERILADRAAEAMYVSGVLQAAALDVMTQPGWRTHRRGLREQLRARRDLLLESLRTHAPSVTVHPPVGGLNLWARLPEGADVDAVVRDCAQRGLVIAPGSEWFPAEPTGPYVRLNFAGEGPERFPEAAQVLGEVLGGTSG